MAKPSSDDFLGNPARFNKVGDRGVMADEPVEISPTTNRGMTPRTIGIVIGLIVLVVFLVFLGEGGMNGIQHIGGRGHRGTSTEGIDKVRDQGSNF